MCNSTTQSEIVEWKTVTLIGGVHDGQTMRLLTDQVTVTLCDGPMMATYHRLKPDADVLYAEDRIGSMFGGRR